MQNRYLNINARLAEEILKKSLSDEFRVLLALKGVASGNGAYFRPTAELKRKLRGLCGWKTERTAKRKIQRLEEMGWLGRDEDDRLYVRSFSWLLNQMDVRSDTVHQISVPFCVESKRKMKAVLFSIATGKIVANRRFALVRQNAPHTSTRTARHSYAPGDGETHGPSDLSVSFLAERFDVCKATAHRWKWAAIEEGLMERTKREFVFGGGSVSALKKAFPDDAHRIRPSREDGRAAVQLTDQLEVPLKYKSRKQ